MKPTWIDMKTWGHRFVIYEGISPWKASVFVSSFADERTERQMTLEL